ncbi:hypothetical protein [Rhodopila sp.]|uniref:hypothetical protein n=1 Tax=Rhodopila sp. TaxID=2480087 RepID=UPI003D0D9ECC
MLYQAFGSLVGQGRWQPRIDVGNFVIALAGRPRRGWHVDLSFPGDTGGAALDDYFTWRDNVRSRGRALLMLFLFSDVGQDDAPTRIRVGSHFPMARLLDTAGKAGIGQMPLRDVGNQCEVALAIGEAAAVYLYHPFLIHAAQKHRGRTARFVSPPPLGTAVPLRLQRSDSTYSPVEIAIRAALRASPSRSLNTRWRPCDALAILGIVADFLAPLPSHRCRVSAADIAAPRVRLKTVVRADPAPGCVKPDQTWRTNDAILRT